MARWRCFSQHNIPMKNYTLPIIIERDAEGFYMLRPELGGSYTALVPALPGCVTYGRTVDEAREMGGWATSTGKYNAGLSFNIDRNNWGCATSRAFREVACRTADTVRLRFTRPEAGSSSSALPTHSLLPDLAGGPL